MFILEKVISKRITNSFTVESQGQPKSVKCNFSPLKSVMKSTCSCDWDHNQLRHLSLKQDRVKVGRTSPQGESHYNSVSQLLYKPVSYNHPVKFPCGRPNTLFTYALSQNQTLDLRGLYWEVAELLCCQKYGM